MKQITAKSFEEAIRNKLSTESLEQSAQACLALHINASEDFAKGFAEWISDNQFTRYNSVWTSTKVYYSGSRYNDDELLNLYSNPLTK